MAATSYSNPRLSTIAFAAGILLFFLPFLEIRCNGASVAQISGKDMVFGSAPKVGKDMASFEKNREDNEGTNKITKTGKGRIYTIAIIAFALGLLGLAISLSKTNNYSMIGMIAGLTGAILLIILMIQVKSDINTEMKSGGGNTSPFSDQFSGMVKISADVTIWFVLCVLSYLLAAYFNYMQREAVTSGERPPANAPQLPIDNPGEQSDFPAAPGREKDLG